MPSSEASRWMTLALLCLVGCSYGPERPARGPDSSTPDAQPVSPSDMGVIDSMDRSVSEPADGFVMALDATADDVGAPRDSMVQMDAIADSEVEPSLDQGDAPDSAGEPIDAGVEIPRTRAERVAQILTDFELDQMRTRFPADDIDLQERTYPGAVDFPQALTEAIISFLEDGSDLESPRSLASDVRDGPCLEADLRARVRCFLNRDTALLELYGSEGFAPENREPIEQNWIFVLRAESLSDHIQWAIIDRAGVRPTYNYGFN